MVVEELAEAEPAQKVRQDGECGDPPRIQDPPASLGAGRLAGLSRSLRLVHVGCLRGSCGAVSGIRRRAYVGPKEGRSTAAVFAVMMAEELGTSRGTDCCNSLMTNRLDVSCEPLDLRSWPLSQVVTARIVARGRTLPARRTRRTMAGVDGRMTGVVGRSHGERSGVTPRTGEDPPRDVCRRRACA